VVQVDREDAVSLRHQVVGEKCRNGALPDATLLIAQHNGPHLRPSALIASSRRLSRPLPLPDKCCMSFMLATTLSQPARPDVSASSEIAGPAQGWTGRTIAGWTWQTATEGPLSDEVCAALARHLRAMSPTNSALPKPARGLTLVKQGSQRIVWRWDDETTSSYLKGFVRAGWSVALRSILRRGLARHEGRQLEAVRRSGLPVPTVWGWAVCHQGAYDSLLVTAGVTGGRTVSQWLADAPIRPFPHP